MKQIIKGHSDFKYIVSNNGYFVDKTLLVKEFLENADHVMVIPRPRRFGKTLNLSMIEHFFDIRKQESARFFSSFNISKDQAFCEKHQNKYPVINLTLKSAKSPNWEACLKCLKQEVFNQYKKHDYLLESDHLK
ncbi:MAG: AAA family ATPase, partial [Bacteroidetes bacterium]